MTFDEFVWLFFNFKSCTGKKKTVFQADSPDPDHFFFPDALFFFLGGGLRGKNGLNSLDAHLE